MRPVNRPAVVTEAFPNPRGQLSARLDSSPFRIVRKFGGDAKSSSSGILGDMVSLGRRLGVETASLNPVRTHVAPYEIGRTRAVVIPTVDHEPCFLVRGGRPRTPAPGQMVDPMTQRG
jgi:hypothetical protein